MEAFRIIYQRERHILVFTDIGVILWNKDYVCWLWFWEKLLHFYKKYRDTPIFTGIAIDIVPL